MTASTIEFTVTLDLDGAMQGIQKTSQLLAGDTEIVFGGEKMPLSDALAEWLLQFLPPDVTSISTSIQVMPSEPLLGEVSGGGGQVGTSGRSIAQSSKKPPRKASRGGSAKPVVSSK